MKTSTPTQWNLELLVNDQNLKETDQVQQAAAAVDAFCNAWKTNTQFLIDAHTLRLALDEYEQLMRIHGLDGNVGYYYSLKHSLNSEDAATKAGLSQATQNAQKQWSKLQFFMLSLGKIPSAKQKEFLASERLWPYKHLLEQCFASGQYTLTEAEERIVMMKSTSAYAAWERLIPDLLAAEQKKLVVEKGGKPALQSFEQVMNAMNNRDQQVRDGAAHVFDEMLTSHEKVATAQLNSILEYKRVEDEIREYKRADSARLLSDDVEEEVVDALVEAVVATNTIAHEYYAKKASLLGLARLQYHERNLEIGSIDKTYSYDEANQMVGNMFAALDGEFADIYQRLQLGAQVDVFPKVGKRGGAFCAHDMLTNPTYVLLNFTGQLRDVTTIAHEFGHAINNELIRQSGLHSLYFATPTSTAEVASTFMEDFIYERLASGVDEPTKQSLMMSRLNDDISTIWRQVACYRFERALHDAYRNNGYVSSEQIGELFTQYMSEYMGPAVLQSAGSHRWWIYWSHIRAYFYNYSYAFGLLISKLMQARVRQDGAYIAQVKTFLSAGTSASPQEVLKNIGIDIAAPLVWQEGIDQVKKNLQAVV